MQAPILYLNGHESPRFAGGRQAEVLKRLRRARRIPLCGGLLRPQAFHHGFRAVKAELFPGEEQNRHPLAADHPIWRVKHLLIPEIHPLWGIEHGCRTVVIYSPEDLSCYWNQAENQPRQPGGDQGPPGGPERDRLRHGRELPADKLTVRQVTGLRPGSTQARCASDREAPPRRRLERGASGDAQPDGPPMTAPPNFDVLINHRELLPRPEPGQLPAHLHPRPRGVLVLPRGGRPAARTSTPAVARSSPTPPAAAPFDAAFRKFVAELFPDRPLEPIPRRRRDLHPEDPLRPLERAIQQGRRLPPRLPAARGREDERSLGRDLLEL